MGGNHSSDFMEVAKEEMDTRSSLVNDFLLKTFDSIDKSGQPRKIIPCLNVGDIKTGIDIGQDVLVGKWRKDDKMAELIFGSSGIVGWMVGLAFSLLTESHSEALTMEGIEIIVEKALLGIMSSNKITDLRGAMKSIIHTGIIDATSSDFSDLLFREARGLRDKLNKLSEAMKNNAAYATMEALDAFITGWGMVSNVYLTVHKISPKKVTSKAYNDQVAIAKTEILGASKVCYQAHVAQMKLILGSYDTLYITFEEMEKCIGGTYRGRYSSTYPNMRYRWFFEYMEKPFRDYLENSYTKFKCDRIEQRLPVLEQV